MIFTNNVRTVERQWISMILGRKTVPNVIFLIRRSQKGRWSNSTSHSSTGRSMD